MPDSCNSIKAQICNSDTALEFGLTESFTVGAATPLFARIDMEKALTENYLMGDLSSLGLGITFVRMRCLECWAFLWDKMLHKR